MHAPVPIRKNPGDLPGLLLRERDSNARPSGYEPDELPLLHPAMNIVGQFAVMKSAIHLSMRLGRSPCGDAAARALASRCTAISVSQGHTQPSCFAFSIT